MGSQAYIDFGGTDDEPQSQVDAPCTKPGGSLHHLLHQAELAVDAHPKFLRDTMYPAKFVTIGEGAWTVILRARCLGVSGLNGRYREVDGMGPTPELAVANLVEGLDYLAEQWK